MSPSKGQVHYLEAIGTDCQEYQNRAHLDWQQEDARENLSHSN